MQNHAGLLIKVNQKMGSSILEKDGLKCGHRHDFLDQQVRADTVDVFSKMQEEKATHHEAALRVANQETLANLERLLGLVTLAPMHANHLDHFIENAPIDPFHLGVNIVHSDALVGGVGEMVRKRTTKEA